MNDAKPDYVLGIEQDLARVEAELERLDAKRSELDGQATRLRGALASLSGKPKRRGGRRQSSGASLTLEQVRAALTAEQAANPGRPADELRDAVRERLRAHGQAMYGWAMLYSRALRAQSQTPERVPTTSALRSQA